MKSLFDFAMPLLYASAAAIAFLSSGSRRAFWATLAIFAVTLGWLAQDDFPYRLIDQVCAVVLYSDVEPLPLGTIPYMDASFEPTLPSLYVFRQIVWQLLVVVVSTAAAFAIPWLVPSHELESKSNGQRSFKPLLSLISLRDSIPGQSHH